MTTNPLPLANKLALITGASKGIGRATALELASLGAKIVVNYSSDDAAAGAMVAELGGAEKAVAIKADAANVREIERLVKESVAWNSKNGGEGKIDILIANAGITLNKGLMDTTEEDWERVMAVNVKGPYFLCQVSYHMHHPRIPRKE
jgi:3-oxoacyl-[acyl-carrier protein] reductase